MRVNSCRRIQHARILPCNLRRFFAISYACACEYHLRYVGVERVLYDIVYVVLELFVGQINSDIYVIHFFKVAKVLRY
ncbi:hypothetical protein D3C80_1430450 [compost metagenome]